jgi:hypothetical protein
VLSISTPLSAIARKSTKQGIDQLKAVIKYLFIKLCGDCPTIKPGSRFSVLEAAVKHMPKNGINETGIVFSQLRLGCLLTVAVVIFPKLLKMQTPGRTPNIVSFMKRCRSEKDYGQHKPGKHSGPDGLRGNDAVAGHASVTALPVITSDQLNRTAGIRHISSSTSELNHNGKRRLPEDPPAKAAYLLKEAIRTSKRARIERDTSEKLKAQAEASKERAQVLRRRPQKIWTEVRSVIVSQPPESLASALDHTAHDTLLMLLQSQGEQHAE